MDQRLVANLRFVHEGHQVVAYVPHGKRGGEPVGQRVAPLRWKVRIDDLQELDGPIYTGFWPGEEKEAETELRMFLSQQITDSQDPVG
ncbi:MAG TPA: hypothetical protein VFU23_07195 [Gemmatimonadales bacterium]|nr:hypothetical protein [Gemmatimonadales bacterium]